jgi:hypothetical protein
MRTINIRRINRRGVAMLLAAALVLIPGTVLAGGRWVATAPIQEGNSLCGADVPQLAVIGSVDFDRKGQKLTMTFHLDGAETNASYSAELYSGDCAFLMTLGSITTDANGDGSRSFDVRVPGKSFFGTIYGTNGYNDTPIVP